jgi:lysophospholipase L1-like esterase
VAFPVLGPALESFVKLIGFLAVLVLSGCGTQPAAQELPVVTAFGDSHTHAGLDPDGNYTLPGWVDEFAKNTGMRVENYAVPGATVNTNKPQLPVIQEKAIGQMRLAVYMPGTNDSSYLGEDQAGADRYQEQVKEAIEILADHFETVLVGTQPQELFSPHPNFPAVTDLYAQATRNAVAQLARANVHLVEVHADFTPVLDDMWLDHFHFSQQGLKKIAALFESAWRSL